MPGEPWVGKMLREFREEELSSQLRERDERIRKLEEVVSAAWDYRAMLPEWWADKAEPLLGEG